MIDKLNQKIFHAWILLAASVWLLEPALGQSASDTINTGMIGVGNRGDYALGGRAPSAEMSR